MPDIADYRARFTGDDSGLKRTAESVKKTLNSVDNSFAKTQKNVALLSGELGALAAEFTTLTEGMVALAAASSRLGASGLNPRIFSGMAAALAKLAPAMAEANAEFPVFTANLIKVTQAIASIVPEANTATASVDALVASLADLNKVKNVKIGVNVSGGGGSTKANQLKAFAGGTEEFAKKIAMPLVALGAASSYVAAKFETAQQRVESFAGASAAEMAALRPQLLKLGEEMGLAPEKLAEGFFHIRSGGLQGAAALDVLRVAAKAASSGLGEMDDVAYAMTSARYAFHKTAEEIGDIIGKAATLSHADPSEFFKNMGQAIPIATALHIKLNDVAGIVAIMTREGLSPAKGFQRITAMLDSLSKPTPQQRKVAKLLGLDMGAFRKEMSDNLMGALDDVFVRSKGNLEKIRAFFGPRRAGDAALAFFNPNAQEENRAVMEGMQNTAGTIEHAHTVAAQTVGYQWKQAMVSIEEAGIKLGDVLAPDIKGLASGLKGLAADFGNLAAPIRNLVILGGGLALTFGGLAKVAQGALAIRGALMLLPGVEAAAAGGLGAMATAAWPVVAALAAVAGVVAGAVYVFGRLNNAQEDDAKNNLNAARSTAEHAKKIATLYKQIETLQAKTKLSKDESNKLQSALNDLSLLSPGLITGYDNQGRALDVLSGKYSTLAAAANTASAAELQATKVSAIRSTMPLFDAAYDARSEYDRYAATVQARIRDGLRQDQERARQQPGYVGTTGYTSEEAATLRRLKAKSDTAAHARDLALNEHRRRFFPDKNQNVPLPPGFMSPEAIRRKQLEDAASHTHLDIGGSYDPSSSRPKRKAAHKLTEDEKAVKRLRDGLRELVVSYYATTEGTEAARVKQELLYGIYATGKEKAIQYAKAINAVSLALRDQAAAELGYGSYAGAKAKGVEARLRTMQLAFAKLNDKTKESAREMKAWADRVKDLDARAEKARSKVDYLAGSKDAIAYDEFGKTFDQLRNKHTIDYVNAKYEENLRAQLSATHRAMLAVNKKENSLDDISNQYFGADYAALAQDKVGGALRQFNAIILNSMIQRKELTKGFTDAKRAADALADSVSNLIRKEERKGLDASTKNNASTARNQYVQDAVSALPDGSSAWSVIRMMQAAQKSFDLQQSNTYSENYTKSLKDSVSALKDFAKETDLARIHSKMFDENGLQQMTLTQAMVAVAADKTAAKAKQLREQLQKVASGITDIIGNTLQHFFDNGLHGLLSNILLETKKMIQQLLIELAKAKAMAYLSKVFGVTAGAPQPAGLTKDSGGFSAGGVLGLAGSLFGLFAKSKGTAAGALTVGSSFARNVHPFADGGHYSYGQPRLVGERGPEIETPRHSGTITPIKMGGGETHHHYNTTIQFPADASKQTVMQAARVWDETTRQSRRHS